VSWFIIVAPFNDAFQVQRFYSAEWNRKVTVNSGFESKRFWSSSGVGEVFWVLPQNVFVYNDITPRPESEEKRSNCF
jgi:hypothetical protein